MIDVLEIDERAMRVPMMTERDSDMKILVFRRKRVVGECDIRCDPACPVPDEDRAADRLFEATVDAGNRQ